MCGGGADPRATAGGTVSGFLAGGVGPVGPLPLNLFILLISIQ